MVSLEPTLSAEKAPEFCLICNTIIPEDELSSTIEEERVKFAQHFVTCLTLDTDELSGELGHVNFCVGCQRKLEEWEFVQEQINELHYRASVLKATLTGTLLESAQDLRKTKEAESVHDEIRKLVRNEYNVRVKVKRIKLPPAVREPIKKIFVVNNNTNNKSRKNNTRRFHRSSSPPVKKIGRYEYLYKNAFPFSYIIALNARKYQCGLCSATVSISPHGFGWTNMLKHFRRFHKDAYEAAMEEETENEENNLNIDQVFQGGLWDDFVSQPATESAEGDAFKEKSEAAGDLSSSNDDLTDLHDDPSNGKFPDAFDPSSALQVKLEAPGDQAESTAADLDDTNNSMDMDIQSYEQESPEDQFQSPILPRHRTTVMYLGDDCYEYRSHTFTLKDGIGVCGVCGATYGGTLASARHNVVMHIRNKHGGSSHRSRSVCKTSVPLTQ